MDTQVVVAPEIESVLLAQPKETPRAEYLEPFAAAARDVLEQELGTSVEAGKLALVDNRHTTHAITVIIGITGELTGVALYGLSEQDAKGIIGKMMGMPIPELDELALSGIAELGNVMAGRAITLVAELGLRVDIAPPVVLQGAGTRVTTNGIQRVVVPLKTDVGRIEAQLAITRKA